MKKTRSTAQAPTKSEREGQGRREERRVLVGWGGTGGRGRKWKGREWEEKGVVVFGERGRSGAGEWFEGGVFFAGGREVFLRCAGGGTSRVGGNRPTEPATHWWSGSWEVVAVWRVGRGEGRRRGWRISRS